MPPPKVRLPASGVSEAVVMPLHPSKITYSSRGVKSQIAHVTVKSFDSFLVT